MCNYNIQDVNGCSNETQNTQTKHHTTNKRAKHIVGVYVFALFSRWFHMKQTIFNIEPRAQRKFSKLLKDKHSNRYNDVTGHHFHLSSSTRYKNNIYRIEKKYLFFFSLGFRRRNEMSKKHKSSFTHRCMCNLCLISILLAIYLLSEFVCVCVFRGFEHTPHTRLLISVFWMDAYSVKIVDSIPFLLLINNITRHFNVHQKCI